MRVHILVEGKSDKIFLDGWVPRAFSGITFTTHPHQGKGSLPQNPSAPPIPKHQGLLDQLPAKLRAFAQSPNSEELAVLVLIDADNDDCMVLKQNLLTLLNTQAPGLRVIFRIAIEESEAFYLGDLHALKVAFPNANMTMAQSYQPDSICNTAELFGDIIGDASMDKVAWAERMGQFVTTQPMKSRSPSFRALHAGIMKLITAPSVAPKKLRQKYRHVPRTSPSRR